MEEVRARLLRDPELRLEKVIDACRAAETTQTKLKGVTEEKPNDFFQKGGDFKSRQNPAKNVAAQQSPTAVTQGSITIIQMSKMWIHQ